MKGIGVSRYGAFERTNAYGIKSRQQKRPPLPSTGQSGNRQSVTASMFDNVRISSNPWIRLKADYRGGQHGKSSLRRCFPVSVFFFLIYDFSFLFFWRC